MPLQGKNVVLGVTGGIAAYKACELTSRLRKAGAQVYVIMTKNACRFIDPVVFDTLTRHRTVLDDFDRANESPVSHIDLPKMADAFLVAPASADIIAKAALGIADDMLSSAIIAAYSCPLLIAPAMNVHMFENPVVQENLKKLQDRTGAELVLSSSWRDGIGSDDPETKAIMDNLFGRMEENGTPLTHWTPLIYQGGRDDEVTAWLKDNPCEAYVIFDDNEYFREAPELERHFVYIEDSQGIDLWDYLKALRILEGHLLPPRKD